MRPTPLQHPAPVALPTVADDLARVVLPEDLLDHPTAPTRSDYQQEVDLGAEHPDPHLPAIDPVGGLVGVDPRRGSESLDDSRLLLAQLLARAPDHRLDRGGAARDSLPSQPLLDLPQHDLRLELRSIPRRLPSVREGRADFASAVQALVDGHGVLGDPPLPLHLDLLLRLGSPELQAVATAPSASVGGERDLLVRGQWFAGDPLVAGLGPGLLAFARRNEGPGPSVAGGVVPHARRDVQVLVNLEAPTELGILSPQPFVLPGLFLGLTFQFGESFLGNDDLILPTLRGQAQELDCRGHEFLAPSERRRPDFQFVVDKKSAAQAIRCLESLNRYMTMPSKAASLGSSSRPDSWASSASAYSRHRFRNFESSGVKRR